MAPSPPTHAGAARTPRYAPWLQRALRVKEETERFWQQQQQTNGSSASESRETGGTLKQNTTPIPPHSSKPRTIWEAVEQDDAAEVKHLLETSPVLVFQRRGASADGAGDQRGGVTTVLHEAAHAGSHLVVQLVLHHIETRFPGETLRVFVDAIDTTQSRTTALIAACRGAKGDVKHRLKIVQLLIHAGADVDHRDAHGDNAVHWCARNSNNVVLRWILEATDAGANAVYAENSKREKPLDIAKRVLSNATSNRFSAQNVYTSLRSVDRKCNVRLKMQVIKRHATNLQSEHAAAFEMQWATALAAADDAVEATERLWKQAIARAEENRIDGETAHTKKAVEAARVQAIQWLDSKDGKNYLKKHLSTATEELKLEVLRGTITKPKDMKKAATHRASEAYITQQADTARKFALESWRAKRPPLPSDPEKLVQMLS